MQNYTILTIGDGLVSQIPAILISFATGLIVTRAGSDSTLSDDDFKADILQSKSNVYCIGIVFYVLVLCFQKAHLLLWQLYWPF